MSDNSEYHNNQVASATPGTTGKDSKISVTTYVEDTKLLVSRTLKAVGIFVFFYYLVHGAFKAPVLSGILIIMPSALVFYFGKDLRVGRHILYFLAIAFAYACFVFVIMFATSAIIMIPGQGLQVWGKSNGDWFSSVLVASLSVIYSAIVVTECLRVIGPRK